MSPLSYVQVNVSEIAPTQRNPNCADVPRGIHHAMPPVVTMMFPVSPVTPFCVTVFVFVEGISMKTPVAPLGIVTAAKVFALKDCDCGPASGAAAFVTELAGMFTVPLFCNPVFVICIEIVEATAIYFLPFVLPKTAFALLSISDFCAGVKRPAFSC